MFLLAYESYSNFKKIKKVRCPFLFLLFPFFFLLVGLEWFFTSVSILLYESVQGYVSCVLIVWARQMGVLAWASGSPVSVFLIFSCSLGFRTQLTPLAASLTVWLVPVPAALCSVTPSYYFCLLKFLSVFCFEVVTVKLSSMCVPRCLAWMGGLVLWPATCLMVSFVVVPR